MKKKLEEMHESITTKMVLIEDKDPIFYISDREWQILFGKLEVIVELLKTCR